MNGRVKVARAEGSLERWAPRLGRVQLQRQWTLDEEGEGDLESWLVGDARYRGRLVLAVRSLEPAAGWPREGAWFWEAPPWADRLGELTGPSCSVERAHALLLDGIAPATLLYDVVDGEEDEEEKRPERWTPCLPDALASRLAERAAGAVEALARAKGLELAARPEPVAVARGKGCHEACGVAVVGWTALRVALAASWGGAPALVLAHISADECEELDIPVASQHPALWLFPFAGTAAAPRLVVNLQGAVRLPDVDDAQTGWVGGGSSA